MHVTLKAINSQPACLVMAVLLPFFNLSCSNKNQSNVSSNVAASSQPAQEKRNIDDDFPIVLALDSGLPVVVAGLQFVGEGARKGDLQIQIKNASEKPIKSVRYWLAPMPCRQYDMPDLVLIYGETKASGTKAVNAADPILIPNQTANILVERRDLEDYLEPKRPSPLCSSRPKEKPHLFLAEVVFADGTAWKIGKQSSSNQ
jgi:hypothetical protein